MEPRELFEKVCIKTEKDLPKKTGFYHVVYKDRGSCPQLNYTKSIKGNDEFWLIYIEYYLQPVEQEQPRDETILVDDGSVMGRTMKKADYDAQFKQSPQSEIKTAEEKMSHESVRDYVDNQGIGEGTNITLHMCRCLIYDFANDIVIPKYASQFKIELPTHEEVQNKIYALCSTKQSDGEYLHKATPKILNEFWEWIKQKRGL